MDWRLAMARLQLQLEGLSQSGWRPPGPAATGLPQHASGRYWPGYSAGLLPLLAPSAVTGLPPLNPSSISSPFHSSKSVTSSSSSSSSVAPLFMFPWRDGVDLRHQQPPSPALPAPAHLHSSPLTSLTNNKKPGRWCAAHVRIAWEIHLGRLQQQQQQKQHGAIVDKDERRPATSSDRPSENGRCKAQDIETSSAAAAAAAAAAVGRQMQPSTVTSAVPPHFGSISTEHSFAAQLEAIYKYGMTSPLGLRAAPAPPPYAAGALLGTDCLNPRVRVMSPSALGLGLYSASAAAVTSTSSVSTSAAVGLAGLNAAASELVRLGDRAAACVGPSTPGLAPWSLPPPFAAVESPSERLCRLDRTAADDRKRNLDDYVNKHRKDTEHSRDAVRDVSGQTQSPTDAVARPPRALSPSGKRHSPVLRPDSTVMSEERGVPLSDASEHERKQRRSPGSDCVGGPSQRPPVWNPFLVDVTAAGGSPRGDSESKHPQADAGTTPPAKVGTATKHSRSNDDEMHSAAKKRKTSSDVHGGGSCVELADAGLRPSGQSPSSSTPDAGAGLDGASTSAADTQDNANGGVCTPDSSCDQQSSTDDVKRFESVAVKETYRSAVSKDFTVVGSVQETGSLLPLATQ